MKRLEVRGLQIGFQTDQGWIPAVRDLSFDLGVGEILGIAGESGSGKSALALALMGLLPSNTQVRGKVLFQGGDLLQNNAESWRKIRGSKMAMIFQDPMSSLHPYLRIGDQIIEPLLIHGLANPKQAREQALACLAEMGISDPKTMLQQYPHECSGGMRQRAVIAMAVLAKPDLLIADEPTTALDVTTQREVLIWMQKWIRASGASLVFISHDVGVLSEMADQLMVMYLGQGVERGSLVEVLKRPHHPYTDGLLRSLPAMQDRNAKHFYSLAGHVPPGGSIPSGCSFHPRCPAVQDLCRTTEQMLEINQERWTACMRAKEGSWKSS